MDNLYQLSGHSCLDVVEAPGVPCTHYINGGFCTLESHFRCPEYILSHEPPLSYSAIDSYCRCHRKFYLEYMIGIELIEKSWAMRLGTYASVILGWLHSDSIQTEEAVSKYKQYIEEMIKSTTDPDDEARQYGHIDIWRMKAMFDAYLQLRRDTLKGKTEYEFRWNIPDYPRVHGFIDLVELVSLEHFGHEFKYTGNPQYYGKFPMSDQLSAYFIGDPRISRMTVTCLVPPEFRQKSATKNQKGESILDYYQRIYDDIIRCSTTKYFISNTYWRSEFDLEAYKQRAAMVSEEIIRYIQAGGMEPFYQNKRGCHAPYQCDFLTVCENDIAHPWEMECFKKRGK